jgi:DNA modification methylase
MVTYYTQDATKPFLAPSSVDLFITHPPYFKSHMEEYGASEKQIGNTNVHEEYCDNLLEVIKHMEYALKDSGLMIIILPNNETPSRIMYKIHRNVNLGFAPMLFWKNPLAEKDTSIMLMLYKKEPYENPDVVLNGDVLDITWKREVYSDLGFANDALPEALCDILVRKYSREGDVVADILGGTGTVQVAAIKNNRKAIYNDVSEEQKNIAKARIDGIKTDVA